MNKLKTLGAIALISTFISHNAAAERFLKSGPSVFNYDHADLTYLDDDGADGMALRFSADYNDNYAIRVRYERLSARRFDADTLYGGVTYHIRSRGYPQGDWILDAGFTSADVEGVSDTGLHLGGGMRYAINDALEVSGLIAVDTVFDTDVSLNFKALYEIATGFSGLLESRIGDDPTLGLGLRFYWR